MPGALRRADSDYWVNNPQRQTAETTLPGDEVELLFDRPGPHSGAPVQWLLHRQYFHRQPASNGFVQPLASRARRLPQLVFTKPERGAPGVSAAKQDKLNSAHSSFYLKLFCHEKALDDRKDLLREETRFRYGLFLLEEERFAEAQSQFQILCDTESLGYFGFYGLALFFAKKGQKTAALDYLEQALDRWYPISEPVYQEPLFKKIRRTKRFRTLMAKHFPDPG